MARVCCAIGFLMQAIRTCVFAARSTSADLAVKVPDDAFYYMVLARNFARLHRWTFDGVAPATGFHLLWGYMLALLYSIAPNASFPRVFFLAGLWCAAMLGITAFSLAKAVEELFGRVYVPLIFVPLFTAVSLNIGTMIMETSTALACTSFLFWLCMSPKFGSSRKHLLLCASIGLLGTLSRSDTGLLPACVCFATLVIADVDATSRFARFRKSLSGVSGAFLGVAFVTLHTYAVSGNWYQASARTKLYWSSVRGHVAQPVIGLIGNTFYWPRLLPLNIPVSLTALLILLLATFSLPYQTAARRAAAVSAVTALVGYVFVYHFDSDAIQVWYVGNFIVPVMLVLCLVFSLFRLDRWPKTAMIFIIAFSSYRSIQGVVRSTLPAFPDQAVLYKAGMDLAQHPLPSPVGAWNSGLLQYYSGGQVVNLDGLVNDDVLPYIKNQTLDVYLRKRKISYLVDIRHLLTDRYMERRGGYENSAFNDCLGPLEKLEGSKEKFWDVVQAHIDLSCTERLSAAH